MRDWTILLRENTSSNGSDITGEKRRVHNPDSN